jgi:CTP:molybdopterin cytidylyltransferase MocA
MRRAVALLAVAEQQRASEADDGVARIALIKSAIADLETVSLGGDQEANELLTRARRTLFVAEARTEKLLDDINQPIECNQVDDLSDLSDSEDSEEFEEQPASRYSFGWY